MSKGSSIRTNELHEIASLPPVFALHTMAEIACYDHRRIFCRGMRASLVLRALANDRRLQILDWLKDPTHHFPPQVDGDLIKDGVCGYLIARKLCVSQPTASEHMRILCEAGLTRPKRIKKWTFYKRNEEKIRQIKRILAKV